MAALVETVAARDRRQPARLLHRARIGRDIVVVLKRGLDRPVRITDARRRIVCEAGMTLLLHAAILVARGESFTGAEPGVRQPGKLAPVVRAGHGPIGIMAVGQFW